MAKSDKLDLLRERIDRIDESMAELLKQRLAVSSEIADVKKELDIPVLDADRQKEKLRFFTDYAENGTRDYYKQLYELLAEISRDWQRRRNYSNRDKYALIGGNVSHSLSKELHEMLADYDYSVISVKNEDELRRLLADTSYRGFNVTSPYKQSVIPMLDDLSATAKQLNSVNTIKRMSDGRLVGYNTDLYGFKYLVARDITDCKAVVLGTGGAALAAANGLKELGADPVLLVSRDAAAARKRIGDGWEIISYEELANHRDTVAIVNATPVGMYPDSYASPLDGSRVNLRSMKKLELAIDLIYNPYRSKFLQDVQRSGGRENKTAIGKSIARYRIYTISGLDMLIRQAMKARDIWTDRDAGDRESDVEALRIKRSILGAQLNLIAVGMPGSGKSTISRKVARELHYHYIDIDHETEILMNDSIDNVISDPNRGENYFRDAESRAIMENCRNSRCVIATGGGSVLRPQNRDIIKSNSIVVNIKRPTYQLAQKNRPISQRDGVDKLYAERAGIYRRVADISIINDITFGESVSASGEKNSYVYDIKKFAYKLIRKAGKYLDEVVDYQWSQYESAERKRAQRVRK